MSNMRSFVITPADKNGKFIKPGASVGLSDYRNGILERLKNISKENGYKNNVTVYRTKDGDYQEERALPSIYWNQDDSDYKESIPNTVNLTERASIIFQVEKVSGWEDAWDDLKEDVLFCLTEGNRYQSGAINTTNANIEGVTMPQVEEGDVAMRGAILISYNVTLKR